MPPIQLSPFLHHLRNILKRLWYIGEKLWKLGIRQISFLQILFRRCLPLITGRFMSKFCKNRPSTSYDKADYHSNGSFDNVDCFRKFPMSFFGGRQRHQSLPLHREEHCYHPDPQTPPSTSQAVVPYSTTPGTTRKCRPATAQLAQVPLLAQKMIVLIVILLDFPKKFRTLLALHHLNSSVMTETSHRMFWLQIISYENHEFSLDIVRE